MIKVSFKLTLLQKGAVKPLEDAMGEGRGAVIGQCWVIPTDSKYGEAEFYYLTAEQQAIVNEALTMAMLMPTTKEQQA